MALPGFIFGGDTGIKSPEDLARARAIAEALLMPQRPAQNVGEGLAVLGQAIRGRREMNAIGAAQETGNASATNALAQALGSGAVGAFPPAPGGGSAVADALGGKSAASGVPGDYFSAIRQAESGGNDNAKAPTSSATGRYQFTGGTWQDVMQKHPELGLTSDGRLDPNQQEKAIRAFTADNAGILGQAGIDPTGGNLYAAHFLGAGGATGVLTKPDSTPMASAVGPEVIRANPFLAGMTVGGFKQWAARKGGGSGPADLGDGAGQQVASLDPSIGMPAPGPAPGNAVSAALSLPQQAPVPQARPDVAAALSGAPMPMQPQGAPAPAPPLPPPTTVQDQPIAAPQPQAQQAQPGDASLPAMAGGTSDALPTGQHMPSIQDLAALAGNPWAMQKYGPLIQSLLAQQMKQQDPNYALDLADKKIQLQLHQQQLGGNFRGDGMEAQAWNILQTADPSSKQYATAYSIVAQPKTQLVQTAQGMMPVQVPPQLPGWLKAPGDAGGAPAAPAAPVAGSPAGAAAPAGASAAPIGAAAGAAGAGAVIPGTKQPPTEMQARNGAIGKILLNEVPTLGKNFAALADTKGQLLSATLGKYGNPWQSAEYQQAANAVKATVSNVLYSLSGASSNPGEVINQIGILTPEIGDKPPVIADKLQRFKTYVRAIASEANDPELTKNVEAAISQMDATAPASGGAKSKTSTGVEWSIEP